MRILVITKRKAARDRLRQEQLVQQAVEELEEVRRADAEDAFAKARAVFLEASRERRDRIAVLADEYGALAEQTGNGDLAALVFQLCAVLHL